MYPAMYGRDVSVPEVHPEQIDIRPGQRRELMRFVLAPRTSQCRRRIWIRSTRVRWEVSRQPISHGGHWKIEAPGDAPCPKAFFLKRESARDCARVVQVTALR